MGQPRKLADCGPAPAVVCRRPAACPGEGSNCPGRGLRLASTAFWALGGAFGLMQRGDRGARQVLNANPRARVLELEPAVAGEKRLFFTRIFAKKLNFTANPNITKRVRRALRGDVLVCYLGPNDTHVSRGCLVVGPGCGCKLTEFQGASRRGAELRIQ